jgi:hypothetical protein
VTLPLDPAVDGDVVNLDAAFGEQLFDVAARQAEAQVPTDGQDDHVGWEAEPSEGGPGLEQSKGGRFSCWQSRCWNAVTANATAPKTTGHRRGSKSWRYDLKLWIGSGGVSAAYLPG